MLMVEAYKLSMAAEDLFQRASMPSRDNMLINGCRGRTLKGMALEDDKLWLLEVWPRPR